METTTRKVMRVGRATTFTVALAASLRAGREERSGEKMIGTKANRPSKGKALALGFLLAALVVMMLFAAQPAHATTYNVNSTDDAGDQSRGNGVCDTKPFPDRTEPICTLRAAIQDANARAGEDTITVPAGTYTLDENGVDEDDAITGDLDLTDAGGVRIEGAGAGTTIIDAAGIDRVFDVRDGTASISGVTVMRGRPFSSHGGGIRNVGTLTLNDSTVSANFAAGGGGIRNFGTLTLNNSTISANTAISGSFPFIFHGPGGGILSEDGTLTLNNSTVSANSASDGGGIHNKGGTLTMSNSAISGNRGGDGVGIYSDTDLAGTQETTVTNSTISGNTTTNGSGGGIYNADGLTVIEHSTITNNSAPAGQGSGVRSAGDTATTRTEMLSTIVSANTNTDVDFATFDGGTNTFVSRDFNLIGDGNATSAFNKTGDRAGVNSPGLGPLANNGGTTLTHALLAGSPAIDAGTNSGCPATDQRGVARPQRGTCDIGSFERQNSAPVAKNDSYSGVEDKTLNVRPKGVLANDTDADRDALTARRVSGPGKGRLTLGANGSFTYKPKKNFNGVVTFVYQASDGHGGADNATVTIRIKARPG